MRPTAAGAARDCDPRVPARREMPGPAVVAAEMLAPAGMAAEMRAPSPAVATAMAAAVATTMATAVATTAAAFWACQREARQRNRENCDRNDA
jgi:hypothetical protein